MKLLSRLSLFVIIALMATPLVIRAQGSGQPQPPAPNQPPGPSEDDLVPIPPHVDDSNVPYGPDQYPAAVTATLELYDYPTKDPCTNPGPDDTGFVPICPPTRTPTPTVTPRPTTEPTTKIVNGLWVLDPNASTYKSNGQCQIEGGDNGGMGGEYQPEDLPKVPVCMTSDNQWITVDSNSPYPLVLANYYSQQQMSRELLTTNGKTSGSVNINTTRQYHIISPTEIEFSYIRNEQGGCTTNSTVRYKLVEANDLVCKGVVMTPNYTPVPTQMPTAQPGETQQPPVTPEPPVQIGEYTIQLPPVDAACSAQQMPPSTTLDVSYDSNQNMFINFGGGSYTLYWNGDDYYEYHDGNQFMVSMATYPGGASLSWSDQGCFVNSALSGAGFPPTAVPTSGAVEANSIPTLDTASLAASYSVTSDTPVYLCAADNKSMLPDLNGAVLTTQADHTMIFSVGGKDYPLTNMNGILAYVQTDGDGPVVTISVNGFDQGTGSGAFMVMTSDGSKSCIAQLTFTPKG